ncbi:MAG: FAD-dependent oxidoreductase [Acidobacteria bacterium]|nr:FAD-dependent oxidoreductase [Acidobacteriota bacterium]
MREEFDVVVIGGGAGGLVTASGAARLGRKVALIERERLGGDCLWTGCVPTKALVASARLLHQLGHADRYGLPDAAIGANPGAIMASMREARHRIEPADDPEKFRKLGIDVIEGERAILLDRSTVKAGARTLVARDVVLATGARTAVPPVEGLADAGFLDHASFLRQDDIPRSVIMLGGGPIGIEFAQMFRRFGSAVTVVEMLPEILLREDHDVAAAVRPILESEGIELRTGWMAKRAMRVDGGIALRIEAPDGRFEELRADAIFVASGRRGNVEGLGLESAGVKVDRSFVVVDKYLRTTAKNVWAVGDINGGLQFTHVAAYEAVKLVRNMLFPGHSAVDYSNIPWAVYIDPEVARVGLTEREALEKHGEANVRVFKAQMHDVDRAIVDRNPHGFVKLVTSARGQILGAHIVGHGASTLIQQLVLARKKGVRVGELAQLTVAYPSLADAVQKAAAQYYQGVSESWLGGLAKRVAAWSQA